MAAEYRRARNDAGPATASASSWGLLRRPAFGFPDRLAPTGRHSHARRATRKIPPPTSETPTHPPGRQGGAPQPPGPALPRREGGTTVNEQTQRKDGNPTIEGTQARRAGGAAGRILVPPLVALPPEVTHVSRERQLHVEVKSLR